MPPSVVGRPGGEVDLNLRRLYAEDSDWNKVVRDLSESAVGDATGVSDFEAAFGSLPDEVAVRSLVPKMSTVVYRTRTKNWDVARILDLFPEERLLTVPIAVNERDHVAWFVTENRSPVKWGLLETVEEISHDLYVLYWNADRQLLFINSSNNDSHHETLAVAVCGTDAARNRRRERLSGDGERGAIGADHRRGPRCPQSQPSVFDARRGRCHRGLSGG